MTYNTHTQKHCEEKCLYSGKGPRGMWNGTVCFLRGKSETVFFSLFNKPFGTIQSSMDGWMDDEEENNGVEQAGMRNSFSWNIWLLIVHQIPMNSEVFFKQTLRRKERVFRQRIYTVYVLMIERNGNSQSVIMVWFFFFILFVEFKLKSTQHTQVRSIECRSGFWMNKRKEKKSKNCI